MKNRTVLGIVCILLALVLAFVIAPFVNKFSDSRSEVLRVKQTVAQGHRMTGDDIERVSVGNYNLPPDVLTNEDEVVGKYAAVGLTKGDYLFTAKLTDTADSANDVFANAPTIGPFEYGADGSGAHMLIVEAGASRTPSTPETATPRYDHLGNYRSRDQLFMHGPGVFTFSIDVVPPLVKRFEQLAAAHNFSIDAYVFHQANKFMLDRLRDLCEIAPEKYFNSVETRANTVSSTIPIALIDASRSGLVRPGATALLCGFGVGLSWGACLARFPSNFAVCPLD